MLRSSNPVQKDGLCCPHSQADGALTSNDPRQSICTGFDERSSSGSLLGWVDWRLLRSCPLPGVDLPMTTRRPCPPAPGPLEAYAARFDPLLSSLAQRRGLRDYLQGLLLPRDRNKTLTALADAEPVTGAQHREVQRLQWFLSESTWDHQAVNQQRIQLLCQDPATAPHAQGVLVIDDTGDRKDGHHTAHVARQYLGSVGKTDNGIVAVTSLWADARCYWPLHAVPYTPAEAAHTPVEAAGELGSGGPRAPGQWRRVIRRFRDGHTQTWWAADAVLGGWGPAGPHRLVVATTDPARLPKLSTWYLLCNLARPASRRAQQAQLAEIVGLYGLRNWVEQGYKQVKDELGWADFQVRGDRAIRRHWTLVCCAFSFCWHAGQGQAARAVGPAPPEATSWPAAARGAARGAQKGLEPDDPVPAGGLGGVVAAGAASGARLAGAVAGPPPPRRRSDAVRDGGLAGGRPGRQRAGAIAEHAPGVAAAGRADGDRRVGRVRAAAAVAALDADTVVGATDR